MSRALRVAIVGYGIAGVAAAIQLCRRGHKVDQFERSSASDQAGAGLLLHPATLTALDDLGILDAVLARGAPVRSLIGETLAGRRVMDFSYTGVAADSFGVGIQRQALINLLHAADPGRHAVMRPCAVESVDALTGFVQLADGRMHGPYDLIVAADGANSAARRCIAGNVVRDNTYQWAALVGLAHDPAGWCGDSVRQIFDGPQHVSIWPVGSTQSDSRPLVTISINVPLSQAARWRENGKWQRAIGRLCPPVQAMLLRDPARVVPPVIYRYRDVLLRKFATGRVVFIGDAAHSMSPQLGQGALLALQDASTLTRLLDQYDDPHLAIERFDVQRREYVRPIQSLSRWLTPMFQSDSRVLAGIRDFAAGPISEFPVIKSRIRSMFSASPDEGAFR